MRYTQDPAITCFFWQGGPRFATLEALRREAAILDLKIDPMVDGWSELTGDVGAPTFDQGLPPDHSRYNDRDWALSHSHL